MSPNDPEEPLPSRRPRAEDSLPNALASTEPDDPLTSDEALITRNDETRSVERVHGASPPTSANILFVIFAVTILIASIKFWPSDQHAWWANEVFGFIAGSISVLGSLFIGYYYSYFASRTDRHIVDAENPTKREIGWLVPSWLANAPIAVMIVVALGIIGLSKIALSASESSEATPIIAFVAAYGGYLAATWIRYAYQVGHPPKEPSKTEIEENVDRLLREAREAIDRNNELVPSSTFPTRPNEGSR